MILFCYVAFKSYIRSVFSFPPLRFELWRDPRLCLNFRWQVTPPSPLLPLWAIEGKLTRERGSSPYLLVWTVYFNWTVYFKRNSFFLWTYYYYRLLWRQTPLPRHNKGKGRRRNKYTNKYKVLWKKMILYKKGLRLYTQSILTHRRKTLTRTNCTYTITTLCALSLRRDKSKKRKVIFLLILKFIETQKGKRGRLVFWWRFFWGKCLVRTCLYL